MLTPAPGAARPRLRAVVTGAAGFIGSHLVEALLDRGHDVVGIDAFSPYYDPLAKRRNIAAAGRHERFTLLPGRLEEIVLDEVLEPGDLVFHLAAQPGVRASWGQGFRDYTRDNVDATQLLLEAAHRRGVERVVHASSSSVYGDAPLPMIEDGPLAPVSPYGVTKLTAEQLGEVYHRAFGLKVIPLRLFTVYGPRQRPDMAFHRFIDAVAAGRPLPLHGDGRQRRDFTYVGDVVRALLAAAERGQPGQAVNVAGGSTTTVRDVIALLEELLGRRAVLEHRSAPPGDARHTEASTARLEELGARAEVGLEEGLRRQVNWQLATPSEVGVGVRVRAAAGRRLGPTIMLYSHDTYGLGHLRRNLAISHAILGSDPSARVVLVSGSTAASGWVLPAGISVVPLPPARKTAAGDYEPLGGGSVAGLVARRAGIIAATLLRVHPDVLLVDHAPLGMKGELRVALTMAREQLPQTRVVLGLRDILDDPAVVRRSWAAQGVHAALTDFYDRVLVHGCSDIFDVRTEYGFDDGLCDRTLFTGYIAKSDEMEPPSHPGTAWSTARRRGERRVLVLGGGGGDAAPLFHALLDAWPAIERVAGAHAALVTGPLMAAKTLVGLEARAAQLAGVSVIGFARNVLRLVRAADLVVTMGGYNSLVEAVAARKPVVVAPRVAPRREQLIRAEVFAERGLAHVHRLDEAGSAGLAETVLRAWAVGPPALGAWRRIDFGGAGRVAAELLTPVVEEAVA